MLFVYRCIFNISWILEHFSSLRNQNTHFNFTLWLHRKIVSLTRKQKGVKLKPKEYVGQISWLSFKYHYFTATPFIVRGAANDWPALTKWDLDFFSQNYPYVKIPFLDTMISEKSEYAEETIKTVIDSFKTGVKKYCKFSNLLYVLPELQKDLKYNELDKFKPLINEKGTLQFFLGPADTKTRLHCAPGHNFFVQIYGRKVWQIYPTKYNQLFLPITSDTPHFISDAKFEFPHLDPQIEPSLDYWEVELFPGDFLYNPSFLWHTVQNPVDSIAVKSSWVSVKSILCNPTLASMSLRVLGINILKIRKDFNNGIFFPKKWF